MMIKFLFGFLVLGSSVVFGQDYYSPTNKDLEPLARFPIDVDVSNGVMNYTLPKELVGVDIPISLNEVSNVDGIRTFSGPKATAVCMGAEKTPGCVVTHRNLVANKKESLEFAKLAINEKFTDNELQSQALKISGGFLEDSGNEPIGFIGALKPRAVKWIPPGTSIGTIEKPEYTPSKWKSYWIQESGGRTNADIAFDQMVAGQKQSKGTTTIKNVPYKDALTVKWSAFHATGSWKISDTDNGWFDLTFNSELTSFDGYFGIFKNGKTVRLGRWHGDVELK